MWENGRVSGEERGGRDDSPKQNKRVKGAGAVKQDSLNSEQSDHNKAGPSGIKV